MKVECLGHMLGLYPVDIYWMKCCIAHTIIMNVRFFFFWKLWHSSLFLWAFLTKTPHVCCQSYSHMPSSACTDQSHFRMLSIIWVSKQVVIIIPQISCCMVIKILLCSYNTCAISTVYGQNSLLNVVLSKTKILYIYIKKWKIIFLVTEQSIFLHIKPQTNS